MQGATNIHESSAVYKFKMSNLTMETEIVIVFLMEAKTVMDTLPWIPPRCASQTISASILSHSVKVKWKTQK